MSILAIDPSLTSTGYAYRKGDDILVGTIKSKFKGAARLYDIQQGILEIIYDGMPKLAVIEGYAMGRFAGRAFDLGELGGVLKLLLWTSNIQTLIVPPTCLKLFATGKGNADKDAVRIAMAKDRGKLFKGDDESDAYGLLRMGDAFLNGRELPRDKRHYKRQALASCSMLGG